MNLFNKSVKLFCPIIAFLFVACSPQQKVQQYSYLVKYKSPAKTYASASAKADPNIRPPISLSTTERKPEPAVSTTERKTTPLSTTERKPAFFASSEKEEVPPVKKAISKTLRVVEKDPIAKTEVKESIDVSVIEAPKVSIPNHSLKPVSLKKTEVRKIVQTADKFMGTPYKYAGMTEKGIDCSGLICQAYGAANISLPRSSWAMAKSGKSIPVKEVAPGHLLFFHSYKGKGVNHVAMVSKVSGSEVEFIHATVSNGVRKDNLSDPYWKERFRMAVIPTNTKSKSTAP